MLIANFKSFKKIIEELHICITELYQTYIVLWNSKHVSFFDSSIRNFRKYIKENYDEEYIELLKNIPYNINDDNNNYWEFIIKNSNRYFPGIEDHYRSSDERYIMCIIPSIKKYLFINHAKMMTQLKGGKGSARRYKPVKEIYIGYLDILIYSYELRDCFILFIDVLNNYLKLESMDDYISLNVYSNGIINGIKKTIFDMRNLMINVHHKSYLDLKCMYICLLNILYYFYIIINTPIFNKSNDILEVIKYFSIYKDNINLINTIELINTTNNKYKIKQDLKKISINKSVDSVLTNWKSNLYNISEKMDTTIINITSIDTPNFGDNITF